MRALLYLLALSAPASAADRTIGIGSFDRLRVEGALDVRVATGASPAAHIAGARDVIEAIEVRLDGRTLVVRPTASLWGERPRAAGGAPPVVTLGAPSLAAITSIAGARIAASAVRGDRVDLSVAGAGAITVADASAADVNATIIGAGAITVAGRAARARLVVNGPATLDASGLDAGELTVRLDGVGDIKARARYVAQGSNTGLGAITVAGGPKCLIRTPAGGRVDCGVR